jgi:hypothetical protein
MQHWVAPAETAAGREAEMAEVALCLKVHWGHLWQLAAAVAAVAQQSLNDLQTIL